MPAAASLTLALLLGAALAATTISGAGATFPDLIYAKWAHAYKNETGIELIYRSIGSGGGIKQIEAKTVTFGATDKPLGEKELLDDGLVQFPMVMGGIVPVINVEGVKGGELVLDGATLAKISSARSANGTTRRSRRSTQRPSFPHRPWKSCTARTARAPRSTSPTI